MTQESTRVLPPDVAFDLLSNRRRRFVLRRLQSADQGIDLSSLAAELSAYESGVAPDAVTTRQRERTYISLYQSHIPKLRSASVVTVDDSGVVRPTSRLVELAAYFESSDEGLPWRTLYLAFCGGGLAIYGLAFAVGPSGIAPVGIGVTILLAIAVLTVSYYVTETRRRHRTAPILVEWQ